MNISIYSRDAIKNLIDNNFPANVAVISFYDPNTSKEYRNCTPVDYKNKCQKIFMSVYTILENYNPFPYRKKQEYDKLCSNTLVMKKIRKGNNMDKENYRYFETEQNGMTVTFVLPEQSSEEECIKKDVKDILSDVLKKYLKNVS